MDRPKPFIVFSDDGKITLKEDVLQFLNKIDAPVSVISLVGKYRTGKSFLLNRFFGENRGFPLGSTVQSQTKGIWLWARPHPLDTTRYLVLLDTEGLYDAERNNSEQDIKMFSLVLLISSCFIYNALGTIDDVLIQQLNLVVDLTENIHTKQDTEEDGNHFNKYFPSFVVILRDFFLELAIEGKPCTPDEYLENALKLKKGADQRNRKLRDYNMPRECIRTFFPRRRCHTLCRPVNDEKQLLQMEKLPPEEINQEFLEASDKAVNEILRETHSFQVDGNIITGPRYVHLIQTYVDSMNEGGVPCISNAVTQLQQNQCQIALEEAVGIFEENMTSQLKGRLPVSMEELALAKKASQLPALEHYRKKALFDKKGVYITKLSQSIESNFKDHAQKNDTQSQYACRSAIQKCFAALESNIKTGKYTQKGGFELYQADKQKAVQEYEKVPQKGPLAKEELLSYLQSKHTEEDAILVADKAIKKKDKEIKIEEEERKRQEEKHNQLEMKKKHMLEMQLMEQESHRETIKRLQEECAKQQIRIMEEHKRDLEEKDAEYQKLKEQGHQKQAKEYEDLMDGMEEERKRMEEDYKTQQEQVENFKKRHEELLKELREQGELSEKNMDEFKTAMNEMNRNGGFGLVDYLGAVTNALGYAAVSAVKWLAGADGEASKESAEAGSNTEEARGACGNTTNSKEKEKYTDPDLD